MFSSETDRDNKKRNLFQNRKDFFLLMSSLILATSIFFLFAPIQMYISNITEFWFKINDIILPEVIVFLLICLALIGLGAILYRKQRIFCWYICLLWGLGFALYIQGNILPLHYGTLNGATVEWGAYRREAIINALLWITCLAVPFAIMRFLPKWSNAVICYSSWGLVFVQLVTTGAMCVTTDFSKTAVKDAFLSDKGLYEISDKQNVIVFILDALDDEYLKELNDEDPYFLDFMDGFTYFSNMTGTYPNTRAAVPYILTGQYYENEQPYSDYIDQAWENSTDYYQTLKDHGFNVGIYTPLEMGISDEAKRLWIENTSHESIAVSSWAGLEKAMLRFVAMRFFPDALKQYVWDYGNLFDELKSSRASSENPYSDKNTIYYQGLIQKKLTIVHEKQYKLIHLNGTHLPFTMLEDVTESDAGDATAVTETRGCVNILREYISQLKTLNVYDKTCIIVTSDHGNAYKLRSNPIFMIKGFNDTGMLQYKDTPVSHENFMATVLSQLGQNDTEQFGKSVFDSDIKGSRRYLLYHQSESYDRDYLPDMMEYIVLPDGNQAKNFIFSGEIYTSQGKIETDPYICSPGTEINFTDNESLSYFIDGVVSYAEQINNTEKLVWSLGNQSRMCFCFDSGEQDMICHIGVYNWMPNEAQNVIIKSLDRILYNGIVTSDMPYINFLVPMECLNNGQLILDFEYPDACSPKSLGVSDDDRILSLGFKEILFEEPEKTGKIVFSTGGNAKEFFQTGWHEMEVDRSWTNEAASLIVNLKKGVDSNMILTYETHPGADDTIVYYNGEYMGILPHHDGFAEETLILDASKQSDSDVQIITFVTSGAMTSKEYFGGDVTDTRVLGIAVSEITFADVP